MLSRNIPRKFFFSCGKCSFIQWSEWMNNKLEFVQCSICVPQKFNMNAVDLKEKTFRDIKLLYIYCAYDDVPVKLAPLPKVQLNTSPDSGGSGKRKRKIQLVSSNRDDHISLVRITGVSLETSLLVLSHYSAFSFSLCFLAAPTSWTGLYSYC